MAMTIFLQTHIIWETDECQGKQLSQQSNDFQTKKKEALV